MKISGFTFLRNGVLFGYPFVESIRSILPLVDEFVVNIGVGDDDTVARVQAINSPKIRIIESHWNEGMSAAGFVYAQQKMIAQFNCTGDWAFYLEGDEVVHENDLNKIEDTARKALPNQAVEALAFNYHHFYGQANQVAISPAWYRREVRIIRNNIRNYAPDGLYWMVMQTHRQGRHPRALMTGADIYHYGHVRSVANMQAKLSQVTRYWDLPPEKFERYGNIDPQSLAPFNGTHPAIMRDWLANEAEQNFVLNPNHALTRREKKHRLSMKIEKLTGWDLSRKHFKLV